MNKCIEVKKGETVTIYPYSKELLCLLLQNPEVTIKILEREAK